MYIFSKFCYYEQVLYKDLCYPELADETNAIFKILPGKLGDIKWALKQYLKIQ